MQVDVDGGGVELLSGGVRGVRVRGEGWSTPTGRKGPPPGQCPSSAPLPPPGRAWRLWAARHSQEEADPLGAQPLPRVLELAASEEPPIPPPPLGMLGLTRGWRPPPLRLASPRYSPLVTAP